MRSSATRADNNAGDFTGSTNGHSARSTPSTAKSIGQLKVWVGSRGVTSTGSGNAQRASQSSCGEFFPSLVGVPNDGSTIFDSTP